MPHEQAQPSSAWSTAMQVVKAPIAVFTRQGGQREMASGAFAASLESLKSLHQLNISPPQPGASIQCTYQGRDLSLHGQTHQVVVEIEPPRIDAFVDEISAALQEGLQALESALAEAVHDSNGCLLQTGTDIEAILRVASGHAEQVERFRSLQRDRGSDVTDELCANMRESLSNLHSLATQQADTAQESLEFTNSIIGTSRKMSSVSSAARILGLNAQIEGVRAGEAGVGFVVVAEEMGSLVDRLMTLNDAIADLGKKMESHLPEISSAAHELVQTSNERIGALDQSIREFAERTQSSTHRAETLLSAAQDGALEINDRINNVLINLQFQDRLVQRLASIMEATQALASSPARALNEIQDGGLDVGRFAARLRQIHANDCVPTFSTVCNSASPSQDEAETGEVEFF
ncbi:MAG: methyl-accepting chemotaxis protein [Bradymonadia bacterium]